MEKIKNECEGCIIFNTEKICELDVVPHISETEHCPCLTCVVKMVCKNDCEKFQIYASHVDDMIMIRRENEK